MAYIPHRMTTLPVDIEALQAAAGALWEAAHTDEEMSYEARAKLQQHAIEAELFAVVAVGDAGRVDQLGWLGHVLEQLEERDPVPSHDAPIADAIAALLGQLPAEDPRWVRYAKATDPRLRRAVATHASTTHAAGIALIELLRRDPDDGVRAVARKRPLDVPIDWWSAAFSIDPWTVIPREARAELEETLRVVVRAAELSPHARREMVDELATALTRLPSALTRDALQRFVGGQSRRLQWTEPVFAHLLGETGGGTWLWQQLLQHETLAYGIELEDILEGVSVEARTPALLELVRAVAAGPIGKRGADGFEMTALRVMNAVSEAWPEHEDPLLVAELLKARASIAYDSLRGVVGVLLARPAHAHRVAPRLLAEQEAGSGLLLAFLEKWASQVIAAAPPVLVRPYALRALDVEDPSRRRWAVKELLGRCHDPAVDPSREARAAELLGRAATRTFVLEECPALVAEIIRARLHQDDGALSVEEAHALVRARDARSAGIQRLDDRDWSALRALRRTSLRAREAAGLAVLFPRVPWTDDDWDDFDALLALDAAEAGRTLATLERQTVARTEAALTALAAADHSTASRDALGRWSAYHA